MHCTHETSPGHHGDVKTVVRLCEELKEKISYRYTSESKYINCAFYGIKNNSICQFLPFRLDKMFQFEC